MDVRDKTDFKLKKWRYSIKYARPLGVLLETPSGLAYTWYGVSPYMGSWQDTGSFLNSEGLVMSFVGEGEHLLVASAVAKCFYLVLRAVER